MPIQADPDVNSQQCYLQVAGLFIFWLMIA
jgi:hypothetical protein